MTVKDLAYCCLSRLLACDYQMTSGAKTMSGTLSSEHHLLVN